MYVGTTRRHTPSSPSVSMETGAYRVVSRRADRNKISPKTRRKNQLVVLGILLTIATITSFGFAYYLFMAGWVTRYENDHTRAAINIDFASPTQVVELTRKFPTPVAIDSSARFISYLPHSGFHNQRIALENAIVMARLLNRTLLVPPARLGKGILIYYPFDHLYELNALSGKDGLAHCVDSTTWNKLPIECTDYYDYTLLPWQWLTNISVIASEQPLIQRWNMSNSWLHQYLGISVNDTFVLKDNSLYQHRFADADPLDMPGARFNDVVSLSLLSRIPQRHIQLGTVFGSSRLRLRRKNSIEIRKKIRENMVFTNEELLDLARSVKLRIGGNYLAVHIRLGNGAFERAAKQNIRLIWWKLLRSELGLGENTTLALESIITRTKANPPPHIPEDISALRTPHPNLPPLTRVTPRLPCISAIHNDTDLTILNTPLFISTDAQEPTKHPLLQLFYKTFPCTFILSDFSQEVAHLRSLKSGYDGLILYDFLLPFLDATVAGNAHHFVGTEGSTFSQFIQDILWRRYHGFEIVQRG